MKSKKASVSHRERLIEELKRDPALAAEYLNVAAEDGDAQSYLLALRTVAEAQGMTKVAKAARDRNACDRSFWRGRLERRSSMFESHLFDESHRRPASMFPE